MKTETDTESWRGRQAKSMVTIGRGTERQTDLDRDRELERQNDRETERQSAWLGLAERQTDEDRVRELERQRNTAANGLVYPSGALNDSLPQI